jgi:hypothetical protein
MQHEHGKRWFNYLSLNQEKSICQSLHKESIEGLEAEVILEELFLAHGKTDKNFLTVLKAAHKMNEAGPYSRYLDEKIPQKTTSAVK